MSNHKHHIVQKYKCKELGIDPDFDGNHTEVTREQHALIHWGYKCYNLKPLLEVCNPPQHIIDMISLGDNRDGGAASLIALGEIEQIDMSGENNPAWKGGITYDITSYHKKRQQTPERKAYDKKRQQTPEYRERNNTYMKEYQKTPKYKAYKKEYNKKYSLKKKLEKQQGQGTLDQFIG
tara:strand:+ start:58 stop:594 length:537 start_codon:yes stop_codon:yes gene_type:complete